MKGPALLQLLLREAFEIVVAGKLHRRAVRRIGLHHDLAFDLATPSAACHLHQKLQRALRRSEIWQIQRQIRIQHAHQRHIWEIEAFRDHLSADHEVDLLRPELPQEVAELVFALDGIRVHAGDAGLRKHFAHHRLDAFGAESGEFETWFMARRAFRRRQPPGAAHVADESVLVLVQSHRDAAILALHRLAAAEAGQRGVEATAIQKQDRLLFFLQARRDRRPQFLGEDSCVRHARSRAFAPLHAHIDDADQRQRAPVRALRQVQQLVLAAGGVFEGFQARGGAAEQNDAFFQTATHHGHIPRMIARRFVLLE